MKIERVIKKKKTKKKRTVILGFVVGSLVPPLEKPFISITKLSEFVV